MKKMMCIAHLGVLLLTLHLLSSQVVQAENATETSKNMTTPTMVTTVPVTANVTDKNSCGKMDSFTLLLPLALAASLLHGWSQ